ncbi:MAG: hypothetical protein ACR2RL_21595 [Gammaproteobacteria bacterium]
MTNPPAYISVNETRYNALHFERSDLQGVVYHLVKHLQRQGQWEAAREALHYCRSELSSPAELAERVVREIDREIDQVEQARSTADFA